MNYKKLQKGSILIYSLIIMTLLLVINFSLMVIFLPKIRIARQAANTVGAIFTADSISEWCIFESRNGDAVPPVMANGATYFVQGISNGLTYDSTGAGNSNVCPFNQVISHRMRGSYRGVTRSFEIGEAN